MTKRPPRVLLVSSHPVQYATPIFRLLAKDPRLDTQVAYCSMQGAEKRLDPEFGVEVAWDIPLLEGHTWTRLANWSPWPGTGRFWGLCNPGVWRLIRAGHFDAVVMYVGYAYATSWLAIAAAKASGTPVLFGTDATGFQPLDRRRWKVPLKRLILPAVFRFADVVIVTSEAGRQFILGMGISESRVALTPFVVDNAWWEHRAQAVDRASVRREWGIPQHAFVALFCAKLQPWKRPCDLLRAFAEADVKDSYLVLAGEGPLRERLKAEARSLGISERTRFLGFVNQTFLPSVYRSSDLLVMPSEYDACPVAVCEAMLCGCPVVLSDRIRGRFDLVKEGVTGFIYPCADIRSLAQVLSRALEDRSRLELMSDAARQRMTTWSPAQSVEATVRAIERAMRTTVDLQASRHL